MQPSSLLVGPRLLLSRFTLTISQLVSALTIVSRALLLCFLVLALSNRKRTRHSPLQRPPTQMAPSQDPDDTLDDPDDWIPENSDPWTYQLTQPDVLANNRHHLSRCFALDPSRYDRRP